MFKFSSNPKPVPAEKKDVSTAILDKKKAPNRLVAEEAVQDDNTVIQLS